jgi:hypothetical protein
MLTFKKRSTYLDKRANLLKNQLIIRSVLLAFSLDELRRVVGIKHQLEDAE